MIYALVTSDSVFELEAHTLNGAIREARSCYIGKLTLATIDAQGTTHEIATVLCYHLAFHNTGF